MLSILMIMAVNQILGLAGTPVTCDVPTSSATTVHLVEPVVPEALRGQPVSGTVIVLVALDNNSQVVGARIERGLSKELDDAALNAARQSTYLTAVHNCVPVASEYTYIVDFSFEPAPAQTATPVPHIVPTTDPELFKVREAMQRRDAFDVSSRVLAGCTAAVRNNKRREDSHLSISNDDDEAVYLRSLDGRDRVAACLLSRRQPRIALDMVKAALQTKSTVDDLDGSAQAVAYLRLAQAEFALRDRNAAERHLAIALRLNGELISLERVPEIPTEAARLAPSIVAADRRRIAREFAEATADMSTAQRDIFRRFGEPDHVESFQSAGYNQVTWWYGKARITLRTRLRTAA